MDPLVKGLWHGFEKNHSYLLSLVADIEDSQMVAQPSGSLPKPLNHAAWVLCHLKTYRPVIAGLISNGEIVDPIDNPYGMKSSPQMDGSIYPAKHLILAELEKGKDAVLSALENVDPNVWSMGLPLDRWQTRWGCRGVAVTYLMLNHESTHLGQLSGWRRALGLPPA